jgi:hypothetical protein
VDERVVVGAEGVEGLTAARIASMVESALDPNEFLAVPLNESVPLLVMLSVFVTVVPVTAESSTVNELPEPAFQ